MSTSGGVLTEVLSRAAARTVSHAGDTSVLSALSLTRSGDEPPVTIPRDPAREAARRELSKRMYHENAPSWFQRALNAFWDWIGELLNRASTATPGGTLGLVVVILAVVALLGALWWRLGTPRRSPVSAPALFDDRPRGAADHRAAAEAHAAQGHWSQAVQERMRAVVRALEERALLDTRPGRTADEAATEAGRALPDHRDRLRTAARDFDDVAYGGRPGSEQSYRRLTELDHDLERSKPHLASSTAGATGDADRDTARGAAE
ncbi:DUF4129 domain-containing protein [Streptomyces sp. PU10]|uniref:DUF4129 domain-containing protein n=1 Tax=Streptomyces sp. PU10 TaxID=3062780 RepID=UPI0028FC6F00|nr:DUF4129 domain-containing protein [Streptomyces sp. PU10]MDU0254270.1 DUF4129 domain-containing protein [Streptomyces sp. PU10]